jgi:hypothetical protein
VQKRTRLEQVLILPACEPGHSAMRALASGGLRTRVARQYLASKGGLTDTCIRTVSLRTGVSVSGKRNFVRRDKGDETSREVHREPRQRRSSRHNSANSALVARRPGNLFESRNAWWGWNDSNLQTRDYEFAFRSTLQALLFPNLLNDAFAARAGLAPRGVSRRL